MINLEQIEQQILELIKKEDGRPIPPGIVVRLMNDVYSVNAKSKIYRAIDKLIASGLVRQLAQNKKLVLGYEDAPLLLDETQEGIISIGSNNSGFIRLVDDERATYFVHFVNLSGALNGDKVKFAPLDKPSKRDLKDAAVLEVIQRAKTRYVGKYMYDGTDFMVHPDDPKMYLKVLLDQDYPEVRENDKILFEITQILPDNKCKATLVKRIGNEAELGIHIQSIVYDYGIRQEFDAAVIQEAEALKFDHNPDSNKIRKDLTALDIITIDPATSKDLDDAIYVKKLDNGNYKLIVAIADVAYYVQHNSALDKEAYERSTSVYLVNQVIPMLPEKLSNDLCSLNPNEKKMALVSDVEIDKNGVIVKNQAYPAIIESKRRFSYDEVNDFFDNKNQLDNDSSAIKTMLLEAKELAKLLRTVKRDRGFVEFDQPEPVIVLDEKYMPSDILIKHHGQAQSMIEDFMICANESVTEIAIKNKIPFIYRVHPKPSQRKLKAFASEAKHLDFKISENYLDIKENTVSKWISNNAGNKNMKIINILLLRMMAKAFYDTQNTFHFGLGSKHYTHFTSPIRRYADLIVHRLLWMYVFNKEGYTDIQRDEVQQKLSEICEKVNINELRAMECERSVNSYLFCVYMSNQVGNIYDGFVSTVASYGLFVELPNTISGLVRVTTMSDDFYSYLDTECALIGRDSGKRYMIGDPLKIKVIGADLHTRQIDFSIVKS